MTLKISFVLWGQLRTAAAGPRVIVEVAEGSCLADATRKLAETNEDQARALIAESGQFHSSNIAVLNGTRVDWDDETPLCDGDEISVMSPIGGG